MLEGKEGVPLCACKNDVDVWQYCQKGRYGVLGLCFLWLDKKLKKSLKTSIEILAQSFFFCL